MNCYFVLESNLLIFSQPFFNAKELLTFEYIDCCSNTSMGIVRLRLLVLFPGYKLLLTLCIPISFFYYNLLMQVNFVHFVYGSNISSHFFMNNKQGGDNTS